MRLLAILVMSIFLSLTSFGSSALAQSPDLEARMGDAREKCQLENAKAIERLFPRLWILFRQGLWRETTTLSRMTRWSK